MCGIAGVLRFDPPGKAGAGAVEVGLMAATLVHRGPDDHGLWESDDGQIALAHRRLSIVDLSSAGRNPMSWANGRLWITYNGEIYNFPELRRELEAAGHRFRSRTDTEVVLAAYDQWGIECLGRFVGMFAFALWDGPRRRLWVVRDRLGKKPVYYAEHAGSLRFASELKAILADEAFPRDVDRSALQLYLRYGYVPSPLTIFANARKLPPAHYLLRENGRTSVTRYWDPVACARPTAISERDADDELERLLLTAVRQRQIADVPLGAFLSGGVDSSLIVALMQEQSAAPVHTFAIRFENPQFNEAHHAAAVARHLRTSHEERTCSDNDMLAVVDRLPGMFDEPFADSSAIPTYLVSKAAREHVTVALSGDGGDELFFGYPRYRHFADSGWALALPGFVRRSAAQIAGRVPARRVRRVADVLQDEDADRYARFISWWSRDDVRLLTGGPVADGALYGDALARTAGIPREDRPPLLDLVSYLPEDILTKVDRASMACSLEVRAPLLDHRVVECALRLPYDFKRRGAVTKWPLRRLLYKRVPQALVDRPKMGFGVPLSDWFVGPLRERMNDYCAGNDLDDLGIDARPVRRLWETFTTTTRGRPDLLWQMYALVSWSRRVRMAKPTLAAREA